MRWNFESKWFKVEQAENRYMESKLIKIEMWIILWWDSKIAFFPEKNQSRNLGYAQKDWKFIEDITHII